jgi:hypothetical protein
MEHMRSVGSAPPALYNGTVNFSSAGIPSGFASIIRLPVRLTSIRPTNDRIVPRRVPVNPRRTFWLIPQTAH